MRKQERRLIIDVVVIIVSICFAYFLAKSGIAHRFVMLFDGLSWVGVFCAGLFFTSVFTTVPAIVLLSTFAETVPLPLLALIGGLGAMVGDCILFFFVTERVSRDIRYILSFSKNKRFRALFKVRLFHFLVPFLGALVIASPLPDELGIAMLGLSRVKNKTFFAVSFVFNSVGIFMIGWLVQMAEQMSKSIL